MAFLSASRIEWLYFSFWTCCTLNARKSPVGWNFLRCICCYKKQVNILCIFKSRKITEWEIDNCSCDYLKIKILRLFVIVKRSHYADFVKFCTKVAFKFKIEVSRCTNLGTSRILLAKYEDPMLWLRLEKNLTGLGLPYASIARRQTLVICSY